MKDCLKNLYFDMDEVLTDFSRPDGKGDPVKRFRKEKDFFYNLAPKSVNIQAVKMCIYKGYNVYILSKSPNKRCNEDKRRWLKKYLSEIPDGNIIFVPLKKSKVDYARANKHLKPTEKLQGSLFDDYHLNCYEWTTADGIEGSGFTVNPKGDGSLWIILANELELI
jgi:hypothetical protein